jgi:hypothetical protein
MAATISRELWVAFGIIALDIAVPIYLLFGVPSSQSGVLNGPSTGNGLRWWVVAVSYALTATLGFFYGFRARREGRASSSFANALYVASVQVSVTHLPTEFFTEVSVRAFNGTGAPISIRGAQGTIVVSSSPKEGGSVIEIGRLPTPSDLTG